MRDNQFFAGLSGLLKRGWTAAVVPRIAPTDYIASPFFLRYIELTAPAEEQLRVTTPCDPIVAMVFAETGRALLRSNAAHRIHEWRDVECAASLFGLNWALVRGVWKASYDRADQNQAVRTRLLDTLDLAEIQIEHESGRIITAA